MPFRPVLLSVLFALAACAPDVSVVDVQASACLRVEECTPESFAALYASQEECVDAYDETTSVCYDLNCTYDSAAATVCQADVEAQPCADLEAGVELPSCLPDAVWDECDDAAVTSCIAELETAR